MWRVSQSGLLPGKRGRKNNRLLVPTAGHWENNAHRDRESKRGERVGKDGKKGESKTEINNESKSERRKGRMAFIYLVE